MVKVTGLKKYFRTGRGSLFQRAGTVRALDGVSFSIREGETLGIVGESGSGKTTAARSLLRLIEPDGGEIYVDGAPVHSMKGEELRLFRKNMQMVFQDPFGSLDPRMNIEKIVSEPLSIHTDLKPAMIRERALEALEASGLQSGLLDRYPHEFSGGQRQRIGIARALVLNPKFIILDEPVSALDVSIQGQILNLLMDLQEKMNLTYLFVAHDLSVVEHISTRIAVMYLGRVVEERVSKDLYGDPMHPYTVSLIGSIPEIKPVKHGFTALRGEIPSPENPPSGCHFHPRCPRALDICREVYPELKETEKGRVACHLY